MRISLAILVCLVWFACQASGQCPPIKVSGPAGVTIPGDEMKFRAEVGTVGPKLEYFWKADKGTIVEGQGTASITVQTARHLAGETIIATVEVGGLPNGCASTAAEIALLDQPLICGLPLDSWGYLKPNDERGRFDLLFAELSNNPGQVALIVFRITSQEKLDSRHPRIKFVLKHARFREFDKSRIWFALEIAEKRETVLHRMPPDAELPCSGCLLFKGQNL